MPQMMTTENEESPMQSILKRLNSYIADPKLVTKETLMELRDEIEDLSGVMDNDESDGNEDEGKDNPGHGGLVVMIGKAKRSGKEDLR